MKPKPSAKIKSFANEDGTHRVSMRIPRIGNTISIEVNETVMLCPHALHLACDIGPKKFFLKKKIAGFPQYGQMFAFIVLPNIILAEAHVG